MLNDKFKLSALGVRNCSSFLISDNIFVIILAAILHSQVLFPYNYLQLFILDISYIQASQLSGMLNAG